MLHMWPSWQPVLDIHLALFTPTLIPTSFNANGLPLELSLDPYLGISLFGAKGRYLPQNHTDSLQAFSVASMDARGSGVDPYSTLPESYQPSYPEVYHPKELDHTEKSTEYILPNDASNDGKDGNDRNNQHRLPFGWTPTIFGIVTALATAIIVAAIVGGGVGGACASSQRALKTASSEAVTATSTVLLADSAPTLSIPSSVSASAALATDYTALIDTQISTLALDCPTLDSQSYPSKWEGQLFSLNCDFLYNDGDLASVFVYTWQDCVEACASMNHYAEMNGGSNTTCIHAVFQAGLDQNVIDWNRNCWLKNNKAVVGTADPAREILSADVVF
ncbi:hypothetical protein AYO20_09054 [Fonsecaea nubica]|uniref:Apple domain-containing protein n=1 Tax=Fonsecaea nubica TaxID=856822 RepID=A0A178CKZ7_9EURO|nr:hypothetical protein AYO20_09054 [Fonsecaea nubica]OAL29762.1 hypothetical protein AYO20_09054 [Fonsecaea nubica]